MHLVTTTTLPPFHCPSLPPCRHVIRRPSHHHTLSPATNMPQPYCRETWCDTVTPACHQRATWCTTVPPCHLVRRAAALMTRQIGIPMYTHAPDSCHSYLLILSDAISPYGLLLKIAMTTLLF